MFMQTNDPLSNNARAGWNCSSALRINDLSSSALENCSLFGLAEYSHRTRQAMILKRICQRLVENDITTLELATTHDHFQCHTGNIHTDKNSSSNTTTTTNSRSELNDLQPPKQQRNQQQEQHQPMHLRGVLLVDEGSRLSTTQINQLCKALQVNRSVQYACVGPKTVLTLRHLWMILEAIASIPTLTSLHLDLQTWIPEGMLRRILATCAAQSSIKSLQMRLTRVSSDHMPTTPTSSSKPVADYSSAGSSSLWMTPSPYNWFFCLYSPGTWSGGAGDGMRGLGGSSGGVMGVGGSTGNGIGMGMGGGGPRSGFCQGISPSSSRTARYEYYFPQEVRMGNVLCTAPQFLQNLKSLKLEYCGIRDEDIIQVCKYLVKKDLVLEEFSLIGNRKISTRGIEAMFPSCSTTTHHCTTRNSSHRNPLTMSHRQQQQQQQWQRRHIPKILRLDLTDCDLSRDQFRVLVKGLVHQQQQEQQVEYCFSSTALTSTLTTLQELVVAWNHQLVTHDLNHDDDGGNEEADDDEDEDNKRVAEVHPFSSSNDTILHALVQLFRTRKLLDISCCGVGPAEMNAIFPLLHDDCDDTTTGQDCAFASTGTLSPPPQQQQRLESLFIRGSRVYPTPGPALRDLIRNTSTLKHLHLLRTDTAYLTEDDDGILLKYIAEGLETNYTLESLTVALPLPLEDVADDNGLFHMMHPNNWQCHEEMCQTWKTIQMYLALNRAGRQKILAPSRQDGQRATFGANDWAIVLGNVSDELDCVYWLLRNGDPGILFP